ncbi:hypothetical protein D0T50_04305 [Bacteroides sp. 214]|uniref:tetratricopeptide repeat protein n=1 Tax=Bacteroides sp. 214 TaxID=2302935 RepID=UPI0013D43345|nr:tetratricopeptide repeat protein [Bacteroides sp. 214]NDW12111.1 hypothetical protein [Bacteroides sp. 214]
MKPFYLIILYLLIVSCGETPNRSPNQVFSSIDSLLAENPDSALSVLYAMKPDFAMMYPYEKAEYALLLTKAIDKNYLPHTSDSLARIAVEYYENQGSLKQKSQAFYYLGRVYQDTGDSAAAVDAFLKALDVVGEKEYQELHTLLYSNLATCYVEQGLYDKAMDLFKKSYLASEKLNDKKSLFFPLRGIGNVFLSMGDNENALYYYEQAYMVAEEESDSLMAAVALCDIAHFYNDHESYEKAVEYITRAISFAPKDAELAEYYFLKGNALLSLHQSDSAGYYLHKSLEGDNLYANAASFYTLYQLEKENGNYKESLAYVDEYVLYYDSIQRLNQRDEITRLMNDYALESHKKEVTARQYQFMLYWLIAFLLFVSISIYLFFLFDRRKKQTLIGLQQDLMQNRSKLMQLQNILTKSTSEFEQERQGYEQIRQFLQDKQKDLCLRLFQSMPCYKPIQDFVAARKQKKVPKELSEKDRKAIFESMDEIYIDFIQRQQSAFPHLSQGDLCCCTLAYMGFSNSLIGYVMGVDPNVVTQRRYRIKGKIDENAFNEIFGSSASIK